MRSPSVLRASCTALILLVTSAAIAGSQEDGPADAIERIGNCAATADSASLGLEELEADCPGLERALIESGYLPLLATEQREQLTVEQLADLQQIAARYRAPEAARAPRTDTVRPILTELRQKQREHVPTWRERLERWWRQLTENQQKKEASLPRWLTDLKLPQAVASALVYASIALVVGLAITVLVTELRVAGVLRRRAKRSDPGVSSTTSTVVASKLETDLDTAAPADRAPLLLKLLVATLIRSGRLRTERSLTHRELALRATFESDDERVCFQRVAQLAERMVYGTTEVPPADHDAIIAAGRTLNARLGGVNA